MTLAGAVLSATQEQNVRARFNLRLGRNYSSGRSFRSEVADENMKRSEPMEVDHFRPRRCYKCGSSQHRARNCQNSRGQVNAIAGERQSRGSELLCWRCNQPGHFKRDCQAELPGRRDRKRNQDLN